jgi:hypothetical protein
MLLDGFFVEMEPILLRGKKVEGMVVGQSHGKSVTLVTSPS